MKHLDKNKSKISDHQIRMNIGDSEKWKRKIKKVVVRHSEGFAKL
jgi:hypothetical protein